MTLKDMKREIIDELLNCKDDMQGFWESRFKFTRVYINSKAAQLFIKDWNTKSMIMFIECFEFPSKAELKKEYEECEAHRFKTLEEKLDVEEIDAFIIGGMLEELRQARVYLR